MDLGERGRVHILFRRGRNRPVPRRDRRMARPDPQCPRPRRCACFGKKTPILDHRAFLFSALTDQDLTDQFSRARCRWRVSDPLRGGEMCFPLKWMPVMFSECVGIIRGCHAGHFIVLHRQIRYPCRPGPYETDGAEFIRSLVQ